MMIVKNLLGKTIGKFDFQADLNGADLRKADLNGADLSEADLNGANLSKADLNGANLSKSDLSCADLRKANLSWADLRGADLRRADLRRADLRGTDFRGADFRGADLRGANLSGADLRGADLRGANLSGAHGLLSQSRWLQDNLRQNESEWLCYKAIGKTHYKTPAYWTIAPGSTLVEVVNHDRASDCACGVNVSTHEWCVNNFPCSVIWRCLIPWSHAADICVPYGTDGKFRAGHVVLLEKVSC